MTGAAAAADAVCVRTDQYDFEGDIVVEVKKQIEQSLAVIADLSDSSANVFFELGFALGLTKPVVPICATPLEKLPFDVRNWNVVKYQFGQTAALKPKLARRLRNAVGTGKSEKRGKRKTAKAG
jgi:nucleoside 2-deoxyribosyltransferase